MNRIARIRTIADAMTMMIEGAADRPQIERNIVMNSHMHIGIAVLIGGLAAGIGLAQHHEHGEQAKPSAATPALRTPLSIQEEHKHLHHQLDAALSAGGKTAEKARLVADVLVPHFEQEEAFAMPPLGLLETLAQKRTVDEEDARRAIEMATRLRAVYDAMLKEHQAITESLQALAAAAREENKPEHAHFAEALIAHAQNEEQILYPTTLLIGEYLALLREHKQDR